MRFRFIQLLLIILVVKPSATIGQASQDISRFSNESKVYSPNGNPKAQGLDFRIKYLPDWKAQEGERPHIVQKFVKNIAQAQISYFVIIKTIPGAPMGKQDKEDLLADIEEMIPEGSTLISKNSNLIIDGERAALLEYKTIRSSEQTAVGQNIILYTYGYTVIYKSYLIQLFCSVGGTKDSAELLSIFNSYKPFFKLVATNFVITSKWK